MGLIVVEVLRFALFTTAGISPTIAAILVVLAIVLILQIPYFGSLAVLPYVILTAFGIVEKDITWSVVYDSKTKLPIDPAYVIVRNMQGREITTIITDLNGRFSLLLPQGLYLIEANKTNYVFPSAVMHGNDTDGKYSNLYFGSVLEIKDTERSVAISIPMDPISEDWNQVEKKRRKLFYRFDDQKTYMDGAKLYSVAASLFAGCHAVVYQTPQSLQQFLVAAVTAFVVYAYSRHAGQYWHSFVIDKHTGEAVPFAKVTIYSARTKSRIAQKTTSFEGQFTCLLSKGSYYLTIERRDARGAYSLAFTSGVFSVRDGYIGKRFTV